MLYNTVFFQVTSQIHANFVSILRKKSIFINILI